MNTFLDYLLAASLILLVVIVGACIHKDCNPPPKPCDHMQLEELLEVADHPYVSEHVIKALEDDVIDVDEFNCIRMIFQFKEENEYRKSLTKKIAQKAVE